MGLDPGSDILALESAILAQDPGLAADHEARLADDACPWKGLAAYDTEDRDSFFGRAADIEACLARLESSPLLCWRDPRVVASRHSCRPAWSRRCEGTGHAGRRRSPRAHTARP